MTPTAQLHGLFTRSNSPSDIDRWRDGDPRWQWRIDDLVRRADEADVDALDPWRDAAAALLLESAHELGADGCRHTGALTFQLAMEADARRSVSSRWWRRRFDFNRSNPYGLGRVYPDGTTGRWFHVKVRPVDPGDPAQARRDAEALLAQVDDRRLEDAIAALRLLA